MVASLLDKEVVNNVIMVLIAVRHIQDHVFQLSAAGGAAPVFLY